MRRINRTQRSNAVGQGVMSFSESGGVGGTLRWIARGSAKLITRRQPFSIRARLRLVCSARHGDRPLGRSIPASEWSFRMPGSPIEAHWLRACGQWHVPCRTESIVTGTAGEARTRRTRLTPMNHLKFRVAHGQDAGLARTLVMRWGLEHGLGREQSARAAIVASELCIDMVRYADGGELRAEFDHASRRASLIARDGECSATSLPPRAPDGEGARLSGLSFSVSTTTPSGSPSRDDAANTSHTRMKSGWSPAPSAERPEQDERFPLRGGTVQRFCDDVTQTSLPDGGFEVVCRFLASEDEETAAF